MGSLANLVRILSTVAQKKLERDLEGGFCGQIIGAIAHRLRGAVADPAYSRSHDPHVRT